MLMALDSDHWPHAWLIQTIIGDGNNGNTVYEGDDDDDDTLERTSVSHSHGFVSDLHKGVALSSFNGQ